MATSAAAPVAAEYYDLGSYTRRVTTAVPDAQLWFDRGLNWLYGFNHGEAIACFGQTSPLGGFVLDNNAAVNCGSGMTVNASSTVTGFSAIQVAIPEPATLGLLGGALAGLVWAGTRKRKQD